ncbi:hypothetical protein NUH87_17485 [Pseudomonas batumici]|uniref:hypothetical protein n=1 Tax=Pseudomonas batumici TaxID=226910 RepID=UPI0030CC19FD
MTNKLCYWTFCALLSLTLVLFHLSIKDTLKKTIHYHWGQEIYAITFPLMILFFLIFRQKSISESSPIRALLSGIAIGYFCGVLSGFIEYIATTPYAVERMANTLSKFGLFPPIFLASFLIPPLFTGGWLTGGIMFFIAHKYLTLSTKK